MCKCFLNIVTSVGKGIALIDCWWSVNQYCGEQSVIPREAENTTPHLDVCHRAALAHVNKGMLLTFLVIAKKM